MSKRARTSFARPGQVIREGDVLSDDHPAVKATPGLFEDVEDHIERLERASANPGEVRDVTIATAKKKRGKK